MAISRDDLDQHGLIIGVSPERFRAVAMPLLFDHLDAQCEGTIPRSMTGPPDRA